MTKIELPPGEALYPTPVVLVSSLDNRTLKANIITIAWCGVVCSNPPLLGISIRPSRYSHGLIKKTGDFVVNIPNAALLEAADRCGIRSGKDIDKFRAFSLTGIKSSEVSSPMIKECPVNIECRLKEVIPLGSHDMFIGEVVAVHADEGLLDKKGNIDYKKAGPIVYNQGEYWNLGKRIGVYGCSNKKEMVK